MNPMPLTDPSGVVRAHACGSCFCVRSDMGSPEWSSLAQAERCCVCHCCGEPRQSGEQPMRIYACRYCLWLEAWASIGELIAHPERASDLE